MAQAPLPRPRRAPGRRSERARATASAEESARCPPHQPGDAGLRARGDGRRQPVGVGHDRAVAPARRTRPGRWQCESNHSTTTSSLTRLGPCGGGTAGRPSPRAGRRGSHPTPPRRGAAGRRAGRAGRAGARSRRPSTAWPGRPGRPRCAAPPGRCPARRRRRARVGLPGLGDLQVGVGLAEQPPGGLQGQWGHRRPRPRRPRRHVGGHPGQRGCRGRGPGPRPSHFVSTTVDTRDSRLPRLLARSAL